MCPGVPRSGGEGATNMVEGISTGTILPIEWSTPWVPERVQREELCGVDPQCVSSGHDSEASSPYSTASSLFGPSFLPFICNQTPNPVHPEVRTGGALVEVGASIRRQSGDHSMPFFAPGTLHYPEFSSVYPLRMCKRCTLYIPRFQIKGGPPFVHPHISRF